MKPKRVNKTKEQLIQEAQQAKKLAEMKIEANKQRAFIKEKFYPFLLENTKDIKDALNTLQTINGELGTAFQEIMLAEQKKLSDSKLPTLKLEDRKYFTDVMVNENFKRDIKFLELFADYPISLANVMITGMTNELKMFLNKEHEGRHLSTVKADFLEESDEQTIPKKNKK